MLNEADLRRPEFDPNGVPIKLMDGQEWMFPRPALTDFRFAENRDGSIALRRGTSLGVGYEPLLDAYVNAETVSENLLSLFKCAYHLLCLNYHLTIADTGHILRSTGPGDPREEACREMWGAIAEVALGTAPKLTAVGSEQP
jgi:hypothetical protein